MTVSIWFPIGLIALLVGCIADILSLQRANRNLVARNYALGCRIASQAQDVAAVQSKRFSPRDADTKSKAPKGKHIADPQDPKS
jgi:hypothetical protein